MEWAGYGQATQKQGREGGEMPRVICCSLPESYFHFLLSAPWLSWQPLCYSLCQLGSWEAFLFPCGQATIDKDSVYPCRIPSSCSKPECLNAHVGS